jgi:RNA polymerase sigma-70 factor, ECF subfamily
MMGTVAATTCHLSLMLEGPPPPDVLHLPASGSSDAVSSLELVVRARAGDQAALDDLFARYLPRIRRWAHGRLPAEARGAHETQDLVQETLTKVFQRIHAFEPRHPAAFRDYVWTTLWNCIRDAGRKYQRRGHTEALDGEFPASAASPLEEAIGEEVLGRYERALESLRPDEREAIVARIELGLPFADVAAALEKPSVAAAHMAVSRALVRLAQEMAHERRRRR